MSSCKQKVLQESKHLPQGCSVYLGQNNLMQPWGTAKTGLIGIVNCPHKEGGEAEIIGRQ